MLSHFSSPPPLKKVSLIDLQGAPQQLHGDGAPGAELTSTYLPAGINNSFERSVKKGLGGREREGGKGGREKDKGSLQFIWKGSGKFKLLGILLLSVSLTVIKKCLNDLNNTWFSRQALIALYQAKRRWMLSRKPQVRQADSVLVWHGVPVYRPVFAGALPALYLCHSSPSLPGLGCALFASPYSCFPGSGLNIKKSKYVLALIFAVFLWRWGLNSVPI